MSSGMYCYKPACALGEEWRFILHWFLHMNLEKHLKFSLQFSEPEKDQLALENVVNKLCLFN